MLPLSTDSLHTHIDGVLVVDKPQGLTSHDVVAAARRLLREPRIGHTGTLDPLATGVLPLAIGRATRLVRFLAASDKDYDATIRFGLTTDSYDITGAETSRTGTVPSREAVLAALSTLTGSYRQTPPAYSAKKVGGRRAYARAREAASTPRGSTGGEIPLLQGALVRVDRAELVAFEDGRARVALTCSAGFYVRAFAHSLGQLVGTGACLEALRRPRAGEFTLAAAIGIGELDARRVAERLMPCGRLLGTWPAATLTDRGRDRAAHGHDLEPTDYAPAAPADHGPRPSAGPDPRPPITDPQWMRLLDRGGALVALAQPGARAGSLHPAVVLV
jgi:tRNA pseudouridine55 synthase